MFKIIRDPRPGDPAIVTLTDQLNHFYSTTQTYTAFQQSERRDNLYELLDPTLDQIVARRGTARVLEIGAGRTGYPLYLKEHGKAVSFTAQDVTASNEQYLKENCDSVFVGPIGELQGEFDLIVSTFVLEHVSTPREFLEHVKRLLAPRGFHAIFCPRYDLPGYVTPSLRHLSKKQQYATAAWLTGARAMSCMDQRPRFFVNCDPSLLHGPWYIDADAVHLVGRGDVERWHRSSGFSVRRLKPAYHGVREWLLRRCLTLNLLCQLKD